MGRIPETIIDEVLARTDILSVVQGYVSLKRAGANHKGLCPFHEEKTPSFNVNPSKGIFKCFGCGKGGNAVGFLMELEGWSFPESVRFLAEQLHIEIQEDDDGGASKRRAEGKKLYLQIMSAACDHFRQNMNASGGQVARMYLEERGIDAQTAEAFGLGYAPDAWDSLLKRLATRDVSAKLAERAGLVIPRKTSDGYYDRFRHRLVFPVHNVFGDVIAFSARVVAADDDSPKYINSPETSFYRKGAELFGLSTAKQSIQKAGYALLVEGNFDVVSLHAAGFRTAVAPLGTALTEEQARLLKRFCTRVVVAFDGDGAGEKATIRTLGALEAVGLESAVVRFDPGDDPDTFVRRRGEAAFQQMIDESKPLIEWALDRILAPVEGAPIEERLAALERAGELMREVRNAVLWEHYAGEISRRLAIEPRLLKEYIRRPKKYGDRLRQAVEEATRPLELDPAEFGLLVVLLDHREWLDEFLGEGLDALLVSSEVAEFLQVFSAHVAERGKLDPPVLLQSGVRPAFRASVSAALLATEYKEERSRRYYEGCVRSLQHGWARRMLTEITRELEQTDFRNERKTYEELLRRKEEVEVFRTGLASS